MNAATEQALWQRLLTGGLVAGELPAAHGAAPWFVRVMLGVAGWIGALFVLSFVGVGFRFVMESASVSFVVGVSACAAAAWLFRAKPESDFASQFALALSLAGQALVLLALAKALKTHTSATVLSMGLFEALLFLAVPNFVHRVWAAWAGASAVVYALMDWHLQAYAPALLALACAWVWLNEFKYARHGALLRAGGYGLVWALLGALGLLASAAGVWIWHSAGQPSAWSLYHPWIGAGLAGGVLLWTVRCLLLREAVASMSAPGLGLLAIAAVLALATLKAPGLAPTVLILLLGFANGNRLLAGLGVLSLLGYLSFYYYTLQATLLDKSALMVATGVALLAARLLLHRWWPAQQQDGSRHA
jgi:hypothetical protein